MELLGRNKIISLSLIFVFITSVFFSFPSKVLASIFAEDFETNNTIAQLNTAWSTTLPSAFTVGTLLGGSNNVLKVTGTGLTGSGVSGQMKNSMGKTSKITFKFKFYADSIEGLAGGIKFYNGSSNEFARIKFNGADIVYGLSSSDYVKIKESYSLGEWHDIALVFTPSPNGINLINTDIYVDGVYNPSGIGLTFAGKAYQTIDRFTVFMDSKTTGSYYIDDILVEDGNTVPLGVSINNTNVTMEVGDATQLQATAIPVDSSNIITWTTENSSVATVTADGVVNAVGPGTATIRASISDTIFTDCVVTVNEPPPPPPQPLTVIIDQSVTGVVVKAGETTQLTATVSDPAIIATWYTSNSDVAVVDASTGFVAGLVEGTAYISASVTDTVSGTVYSPVCAVTVISAVETSVTLDKTSVTMDIDGTTSLTATVWNPSTTPATVSWYTYNSSVATVSDIGVVTAKGAGKTTIIRASYTDSVSGSVYYADCTVTVNAIQIPEDLSVSLDDTSITLNVNETKLLKATVKPISNPAKTVSWYTYDESIATVVDGLITAKGAGKTTTIRASYTDSVSGSVYYAECIVTVNPLPKIITVTITPTSITKYIGQTQQLTATVSDPAKTVSWYTYNSSVADVSSSGLVTAKGVGTTKVRAYYQDTVSGNVYADCTVTVQIAASNNYVPYVNPQAQNLNNLLNNINITNGKEFTFNAENSGNGTPAKAVLPIEAIDKIQEKGIESIKIVTDTATLFIAPGAFDKKDISSVTIEVKQVNAATDLTPAQQQIVGNKPVYDFKILTKKSDGSEGSISKFTKPVEIVVPYKLATGEDPRKITVFFIDENGKLENRGGTYDAATGTVTFKTNHFSKYFIQYNDISFKDLSNVSWAEEQIEVMAAKGIINGTGENKFSPDNNITRGDFLLLLVKTLGLTATVDSNFSDVKSTDYYYEAVGIAKKLGLANGTGSNTFEANKEISRQDMMVLVARAMKVAGQLQSTGSASDLQSFKDKSLIADYATLDVATLVKEGVVKGSGSNIEPNGNTTRAEAAVLLYRIYNK